MKLRCYLLGLLAVLLLAGCGDKSAPAGDKAGASAKPGLTVLAGSELKDIEPLLPQIEQATGLHLQLKYAGSLDVIEQLQAGASFDLAWIANNKYALLDPAVRERVKASERTMISPVVLGVKASKAKALGWDKPDRQPTWADIAKVAGAGQFRFAMTNPASSNSGFSAVLGLAAAVAGKGDALETQDINKTALTAFARAQSLTAGSSGWLLDAYVGEQDRLDGIVNYASSLHALNQGGKLHEQLVLVYPKDGVITADYPLMLINPAKRADYDKLVAYLKGAEFQKAMTAQTYRQPLDPTMDAAMPRREYFELAFPAKLAVVDALLDGYQNEFRRPADSTFVIDISGSMGKGGRIEQLRGAIAGLAGSDASLSGRFSRFRARESISVLTFSDVVHEQHTWTLAEQAKDNTAELDQISDFALQLQPGGGTAIYSAAQTAYQNALARQARNPDRVYTLVLMTDGENNNGLTSQQFVQWFASLRPEQRRIRIFAVQFGEASRDELEALTGPSGGRVFDGSKAGLQAAFKEIRGYQ
ncbi:Ca-activated chloride channel family protein [Andreprevotia lacus DSM 23236]|jgi:Ca-activated chloride channel family protein|uniref:Ca-activated chloride channel family protein n=1 Tax=Andreprevotia lacus DSM 23236 TaxID=1121001 RepID=A0A1W1XWJ6_9NEIS|nr:VWA domain-containing protein [Andreprevotia lacus]SMC28235.1 Ca-activated chloride channel family protein [Andreprevotia lacus DSM 23236]